MKRNGFTIIELMMVITVIAILITITSGSILGAMQRARGQRAEALCVIVRQGLETYYAQKGTWPWGEKSADHRDGYYWLTESEIKNAIFELVKEAHDHNPMMDISGLYVSTQSGEPGTKHFGMDFMTAVKGSKRHPERTPASQLQYGYPESGHGYFRRFVIKFSPVSDKIIVRRFTDAEEKNVTVYEEH